MQATPEMPMIVGRGAEMTHQDANLLCAGSLDLLVEVLNHRRGQQQRVAVVSNHSRLVHLHLPLLQLDLHLQVRHVARHLCQRRL